MMHASRKEKYAQAIDKNIRYKIEYKNKNTWVKALNKNQLVVDTNYRKLFDTKTFNRPI